MSVTISTTNKPLNPRAQDLSPKGYNRASLYSGKALDFDGVNDYVSVGDNASLDFTTAMSAFCYVKVDSLASLDDYLLSKYDYGNNKRSWVMVQDAGQLLVLISKNGFSASPNAKKYIADVFQSTNEYYFVGFTFESNVLKVYVNGQEYTDVIKDIDSEVNSIYVSDVNVGVGCGHFAGSPSNFINGQVSGVRLFNTALTAAQVSDLYLNPEKIVPDGVANSALKLWLPMMEGAGTTAYDGSGNGNHGTINGATWVSGVGAPVAQTALVGWNKGVNLLVYSEQFDNAVWIKQTDTTISSNATTSPDGYTNADKLVNSTSVNRQAVYQNSSLTGVVSFSVFAKKAEYDVIQLTDGREPTFFANFDLTNGVLGSVFGYTASIQDYGNNWYRCAVSANYGALTINQPRISIAQTPTESRLVEFAGSGTNGVFIWGAQLTATSDVQPYVETLATAQTSPVLLPQGLTANKDITGVNSVSRNAYALNLDGASWAEVHDNASLDFGTGDFTLEAWAKLKYVNTGSSINSILSIGTNASLTLIGMNSPSSIVGLIDGTGVYEAVTFDDWAHIVLTKEGISCKLYLNAINTDTFSKAANITNTENKYIGGDVTSIRYYKDQIALPRIYNRALTATEVARNYNADKSKFGL